MTVNNPAQMIMMANAARQLSTMFPGYFDSAKHDHYKDFGWPTAGEMTFKLFYDMYSRNGLANAAITKTILKTWQTMPTLLEKERDGSQGSSSDETGLEKEIRQRFDDLRLWQKMAETDKRGMVGAYSGLIMRFADNKLFSEPVDRVPGGLKGLVEVIPAWEGQLLVSAWDTDERSETYGQPTQYTFNESQVAQNNQNQPRSFQLHPDRVIIWSQDGTVHCRSRLEPGFNDLLTLEKVTGAGGEGFWKNSKQAPVLQVDKEMQLDQMLKAFGASNVAELTESMDDKISDWQRGFDQLLMFQGIKTEFPNISMPDPQNFVAGPRENFAASMSIPLKILLGSQTGERASTEDANEWAQTNMSRRAGHVVPTIMEFVNRLERFSVLPESDWFLEWDDLTEASAVEKIDRANKMSEINQKSVNATREIVYTSDEIRRVSGYEPLVDSERFLDDPEEQIDALGGGNDDVEQ